MARCNSFSWCVGSGASLQEVHEGDEESEPLSLAMKAGGRRSHSVPTDIEEPEPLSMALKPGRSLPPPEPAPLGDEEPEPLSMAIKAGHMAAQPPSQHWTDEEPEPLSMAMKAGKPLQPQQATDAPDDREPLSMAIRSSRRISPSAAADARESLARRLEDSRHQQAVQDSAADMHAEESPLSAAAKAGGLLSAAEEEDSQRLVLRAKAGRRLHMMLDAEVKAAHMAAGGDNIAQEAAADGDKMEGDVNRSNDMRELLSRAAGIDAAELAANEPPQVPMAPDMASSAAAPGEMPCCGFPFPTDA